MCATCVAEGVTYVGGAVAGLRIMAVRAGVRTRRQGRPTSETDDGAAPVITRT